MDKTWHLMIWPTIIFMNAFAKYGTALVVTRLFEKIEKNGIQPSAKVLGAAVKAYCKSGQPARALRILQKLHPRNVDVKPALYETVVEYLGKDASKFETIWTVLPQMKEAGLTPTPYCCNQLIEASTDSLQAYSVLRELIDY